MRVALPVPVDRLFDYTLEAAPGEAPVPDATAQGEIARGDEAGYVGRRVRVAFGGQKLLGLIVPPDLQCAEGSSAPRTLSPIEALIDEEPAVSAELIRVLAEEAAAIYCPIGLAIAHALPPGAAPRVARPWALTRLGERALAQGALGAGALGGPRTGPGPAPAGKLT